MTTLAQRLNSFLSDFESVTDRELQAEMLLEIAQRFEEVPSEVATRPFSVQHRVPACESDAYVWVIRQADGTLESFYAVENPQGVSAKALSVILREAVKGARIEELAALDENIVSRVFGPGISMGKGEGLRGIVRYTKALAGKA